MPKSKKSPRNPHHSVYVVFLRNPTGDGKAPGWNSGAWTHLGTTQPGAVGPRASETLGPVAGLAVGRPREPDELDLVELMHA